MRGHKARDTFAPPTRAQRMKDGLRYARGRRRHLTAIAGIMFFAAAGTGTALAVQQSGSVYLPQLGVAIPTAKLPAVAYLTHAAGAAGETTAPATPPPPTVVSDVPAGIFTPGTDTMVPVSPAELTVSNGWSAGDGAQLTAVYAGSSPGDPSDGRFVVVRSSPETGTQTVTAVDVPGSNGVTVDASAPAGQAVDGSAQDGNIPFDTGTGLRGDLNLATNTVTVAGAGE
jgi:hypothetical protein